ncbi:hypothetical protein F2Q70_00035288 [Brassica cretica]|uniref:Uncharacterized protein n=1 Tax=Brassica cretica TaxID=69181 RepID=A0A8S9JR49_BRACR|nr:hypothetical protein F2Q70_00035288 [Brassica cretica]
MPPVLGQSASCSRRYARFTEEWSVCLARGSCRGDEGLSILTQHWCRSTLMPEYGLSIFYDR